MKTIRVEINGTTPLLMNKYNIEAELERQKGKRITKTYDPKEEAEKSAYWGSGKKKELIVPSEVIYASILNASSFHKIGKRSAKSILAGSIRVEPMEISLGTNKYEIDTRPVVIQRARVLKSRARIDNWNISFNIVYSEKLIADPQIIKTVLEEAGERIGIMDFRPQRGGAYGCFKITKFIS
ncbi:hypothetical protein LCGC14_1377260 [marine sediment metagenome]|uniref:Uncharacterized protein n=1 Tax=marine sediment metagenome TaxID=412755 RepID=A0A0F9KPM4_9ZZZZ